MYLKFVGKISIKQQYIMLIPIEFVDSKIHDKILFSNDVVTKNNPNVAKLLMIIAETIKKIF